MKTKRNDLTLLLLSLVAGFASLGLAADNAAVANEGLLDVRAPVSFPANYFYLLIIPAALLIGSLLIFVYLKRKRKIRVEELPVDTRRPWEIAYDQFKVLEKTSYLQEGRFKEYYSELSGIIRLYFENRFNIRAPEMTTEEFLRSLERSRDLTASHKETLKKFMASCDIIKFAKHIPGVDEAKDSFAFARQLVDETKVKDDI